METPVASGNNGASHLSKYTCA